jgi:Cft2 family RNA processing exonuclease
LREEVAEAFRFDPEAIDYLLLTHAQLDHCGRLPRTMQVFLDAPIATSATRIFEHHPECYEAETAELFREGRAPFQLPGLHFTRETADSIALNGIVGGAVILAGSAMCTGGRVLHHLKINVWREDSSVGLAARGTLARQIIYSVQSVRLSGEKIRVRARIHAINGFSAHADRDKLLACHDKIAPGRTFLGSWRGRDDAQLRRAPQVYPGWKGHSRDRALYSEAPSLPCRAWDVARKSKDRRIRPERLPHHSPVRGVCAAARGIINK